ncbi:hypothetical protein BKA80DRAFT_135541 [Phyllosticta citrichinensis]
MDTTSSGPPHCDAALPPDACSFLSCPSPPAASSTISVVVDVNVGQRAPPTCNGLGRLLDYAHASMDSLAAGHKGGHKRAPGLFARAGCASQAHGRLRDHNLPSLDTARVTWQNTDAGPSTFCLCPPRASSALMSLNGLIDCIACLARLARPCTAGWEHLIC